MIPNFYEFFCPTKIVSGIKSLSNLPYEIDQLGAHRAMLVTDQGVVGAGLLKIAQAAFEGSNCVIAAIFDKTPVDSSSDVCNQIAATYRENKCDCFVALGGGSVIDTTKGANIVVSENAEDLLKYQGFDRLRASMQPLIVIPTTSGTGSEVTLVAVIANVKINVKMSFSSTKLYPNVAILDPRMLVTMPKKITAATGMDALTHAIEAYYNLQKNPMSDAYASAAIALIRDNLVKCVEDGSNASARLAMANAALMAGISFSNSLVGIIHGMAHAVGAIGHIAHGVANAILLPWGMEYNLDQRADVIAELAPMLGVKASGTAMDQAKAAIQAVRDLNQKLHDLSGLPITLQEAGLKEDKFEEVAKAAINDGAMNYSPRDATINEIIQILKKAYS